MPLRSTSRKHGAKAYLRATQFERAEVEACTPRSRPLVTIRVRASSTATRCDGQKDALRVKPQGYVEYKDHITREARDAIKAAAATRAKRAAEEAAAEEREAEQRRLARAEQYAQQKRATAERAQLEREIEELREQMRREPKAILL